MSLYVEVMRKKFSSPENVMYYLLDVGGESAKKLKYEAGLLHTCRKRISDGFYFCNASMRNRSEDLLYSIHCSRYASRHPLLILFIGLNQKMTI